MLFRQLLDPETSTYTYLIADRETGQAAFVDPVLERVERDLQLLEELGLKLGWCLETHVHADHITGAGCLREYTGCKTLVPADSGVKGADRFLTHGDTVRVGSIEIQAIATPGHTDAHLAFLVDGDRVLTGDALLIRGCGRTDFQGGDAGKLYDVVMQRLFALPDETHVYPGHDYKGFTVSSIGEEKRYNARFARRDRAEFITLMANLNLPNPKRMLVAVPANRTCGNVAGSSGSGV